MKRRRGNKRALRAESLEARQLLHGGAISGGEDPPTTEQEVSAVGPHNVADIQGNGHNIVFHRSEGPIDKEVRPIVVTGDDSNIRNETEYSIILEASASGNTVFSVGPVTDHGANNSVSRTQKKNER
jgi:hypothetical protein